MNEITCTRKLEFDAGHRLVKHESKCRHPHGHRYVAEVTCAAESLDEVGRVIDFGDVKAIVGVWIDEHWDHAFIANADDEALLAYLGAGDFRHYKVPFEPTAENLAAYLLSTARRLLSDRGINVTRVRLYETPNCWADAE